MAALFICTFFVEVIAIQLISNRFYNDTRRKCHLNSCLLTHSCLNSILHWLFEFSLKRRLRFSKGKWVIPHSGASPVTRRKWASRKLTGTCKLPIRSGTVGSVQRLEIDD